jgi:Mn2+/Fe2+ NRAMP family transporter
MGEGVRLLAGGHAALYVVAFGVLSIVCQVAFSYERTVRVLKWLTLGLFAYVAVILSVSVPWRRVAIEGFTPWRFIPAGTSMHDYAAMVVAVLGTTISPYLFFWQAAQEVEHEIAQGRATVKQREGASKREIRRSRNDVLSGMFFSNMVMYFIILTSAATLHAHGKTTIGTARDAAEALRPLAGTGPTCYSAWA